MNYLGVGGISRFLVGLKGFYSGINGATLTGAIDVVIVEQEDGSFKCSPFHVRFGKLGVLRAREKVVDIEVNGLQVPIRMKLGESGEAFFVEEMNDDDELNDENLATSPLPMSPGHSDNDSLLARLSDRRGTEEALELKLMNPPNTSLGLGDGVQIINLEDKFDGSSSKGDETKARKRRKKRKKTQGTKSDGTGSTGQNDIQTGVVLEEAMFSMDEDLARVSEALSGLDLSDYGATSMSHSRSFHRDFYSDTEVDATCTPQNSRPSTPIQSDSEYEITKFVKEEDDQVGKWSWGELPSPGVVAPAAVPLPGTQQQTSPQPTTLPKSPQKSSSDENPVSSDDESRNTSGSKTKSMLSRMFSFTKRNTRQTNVGTNNNTVTGMYLDEINPEQMDPDQFALYFPNVVRDSQREYFRKEDVKDEDIESGNGSSLSQSPQHVSIPIPGTGMEKFKKTLRMSSDQIRLLGLKKGQNEAVFSVTTAYQGTTSARCHIYLWRYDDRIVVSDIDGTITKSDVLGHVLPMIGNDWAQSGVAQLFTQIQGNGYKMLYLSSRSIGQASSTRDYLRSIKQDDVTLPDGPLLLNPTSLMSAFHREVIERRPEEFKIACLKDIQLLFPTNPFHAGYGNRINDVWAYRAVEIPVPRIFTINHRGELRHALTNTFQSSYTNLIELVEHIFPVYKDKSQGEADGFSTFEFWRDPISEIPTSVGILA